MSEFKETANPKEVVVSDQRRETDSPKMTETDAPRIPHNADLQDSPFSETPDIFSEIFKQYGLVDTSASEKSEANQTDTSDGNDYSQYLEKREDGKYYDKETGKSYDSVEAWKQAQETLAKRYEGTANYYEEKAKKEWARFKNAEANGESDAEKWEHYRRSQEYYAKAKECREKAETIKAKLNTLNDGEQCADDQESKKSLFDYIFRGIDKNVVFGGLDRYDFNGIDINYDTEKLDSLLEKFQAEKWENLSVEEQKETVKALADYITEAIGLENPPDIQFYEKPPEQGYKEYGGFNRETNTMLINECLLSENEQAVDTIAHELWHSYQYERAKNPKTEKDYQYLYGLNNYIPASVNFEAYRKQLIEAEARAFALQFQDKIKSIGGEN